MDGVYKVEGLFEEYFATTRCPQCGTHKPNLSKVFEVCTAKNLSMPGSAWGVFACAHCLNLVMVEKRAIAGSGRWHLLDSKPARTYPLQRGVSPDVPERARRYLLQAIEGIGQPDGSVVMVSSAVDAMLKAKGLTEGSVHRRIEQAVRQNLMTQSMADWAHEIRLAANEQRHADEEATHATTQDARKLIDFATALADFLFVLPARIDKGRIHEV